MGSLWTLVTVITHKSEPRNEHLADFGDSDSAWRYTQQTAARLISTYLRKDQPLSADIAQSLWQALRPLTRHEDPTPNRETEELSGSTDALTLSLNSTRPVAIRTSAQLLNALDRLEQLSETPGLLDGILQELNDHLGPSADPRLTTAAVFGEIIGILINTAPGWVEANASTLFGGIASADEIEQAWSDVAFSVAVSSYSPSVRLLSVMRPWFEASFETTYLERDHTVGWHGFRSPAQHVGDHILLLYVYDLMEFDDSLIRLQFSSTTPEVRSDVLGHLGWQFMHNDRDEPVKARAQALVDWRVEEIRAGRATTTELNDFYWWVKANRFPAGWWLPILDLAASDTKFNTHLMIGTALAEAAIQFPAQSVSLLAQLLPSRDHAWERYDLIENAPPILAAALDSDDETAHEVARTLMNRLGREGFTDLDESVDKFRVGR